MLPFQRAEAIERRFKLRIKLPDQFHFRLGKSALLRAAHDNNHAKEAPGLPEKQADGVSGVHRPHVVRVKERLLYALFVGKNIAGQTEPAPRMCDEISLESRDR